jgi:oxygen-independent coproporphyrinogen-3 oxidase
VTRLSLGVENFDDRILELNGRAHRSPEIAQAYRRGAGARLPADQHRPHRRHARRDRGELARCVEKTLALEPDSVTIYQMELPFNTTISRTPEGHGVLESRRDWPTKRRWVAEAFEALEARGYHVGSAYTAVKDPSRTSSSTRDRLWQGADMVGLGVASFGHVNGVHMQNADTWETYSER